ncbi:hypothetical protein [Novosphingobium sp. B 225]|uniref:hypothetical protein n=1 Tax=Novosphingobium sp. B 225 TaxID=1961849 RepID=UPI001124FC5B|nr:hypothetical protein [Novosphingobium sp. B 225]
MLNDAIDRIAESDASSPSADAVASSMTAQEIREAAIIHLSALLEGAPDSVGEEDILINGLKLKFVATDKSDTPIHYDDVAVGFAVEGASLARRDGPTSLAALLRIFLYARDCSDSLLFLPAAMRSERIVALAKATDASERFVRFVLAGYHNLSARAAA